MASHKNQAEKIFLQDMTHSSRWNVATSFLAPTEPSWRRIFSRLEYLYGKETAEHILPKLERIIRTFYTFIPPRMMVHESNFNPAERFTQKDIILITYGDLLRSEERPPLGTLAKFCETYLGGTINTLHILPFFPSSSDRGFAVIDFEAVDHHMGSWKDIGELGDRYQLMFDGVINHVSSKSPWFQEFLNGNPQYKDFFITFQTPEALTREQRKMIFRPRTSDILTEFMTAHGPVYVWTTFSEDQIDLNYKNPEVLLRVIKILLSYVQKGADIIRLDAVTYLWAEPGTRCIHLRQTHEIVKLFRDLLDTVAPHVALVTETNVPHEENISYFGNGYDEAQMVYNFALPPLVLYTFYAEDATLLSAWAKTLVLPSDRTAFFNFLDSHDGIGLMAVKHILSEEEIDLLLETATERGGLISYKTGETGEEEPYEINITWFSALNDEMNEEDIDIQIKRFVASRLIALILRGVPGIYLHSLIGTQNDILAVMATKSKREINRTILDYDALNDVLNDSSSRVYKINRMLGHLIGIRTMHRAFHPNGPQQILDLSPSIFAILRSSPEGDEHILCLINVTPRSVTLILPASLLPGPCSSWTDLIRNTVHPLNRGRLSLTIQPYDALWLTPARE